MQKTKIVFVYHTHFWIENDVIVTSHAAIGRYIDALSPYFSEVILAVPSPGKMETKQYSLKSKNLKLLKLPHYHNIQGFWLHAPIIFLKLFFSGRTWGILNIRMPTHLGFLAFLVAKFWKKPVFIIAVGEFYPYNSLSNYPYIKQKMVNSDSIVQDYLMALMISKCITFTNGEALFEKFKKKNSNNIYLMRSSTINAEDIAFHKNIHELHNPIRILTVAVISPSKGTSLIPSIISVIKGMGYNIEWHYIGKLDGSSGEQELKKTMAHASELGVSEELYFHGSKSWDDLQLYYRDSDIFVLPTYVEGVPRVLLEAQSAGLPIVTTMVGGIPNAIKHGYDGLLVMPGDPDAIADAVVKIIQTKNLYCYLMKNGLKTAEQLSLESETKRMLNRVKVALNISFE